MQFAKQKGGTFMQGAFSKVGRMGKSADSGECPARKTAAHNQLIRVEHQFSTMLYTIALILIIAWLLGLVSSYTIGGFIHILLIVAIIMVLVRLIQGKRV
jgi:hypothetical protein